MVTKSPQGRTTLAALWLATLTTTFVGCETPPEPQDGALSQRTPPPGEFLTDPETGHTYRHNPNRRVISPLDEVQAPTGVQFAQVRVPTTFTDDSGTVHAQIVECSDTDRFNHILGIGCDLDPEFVLTGGGAEVFNEVNVGRGALLLESRPLDGKLSTWVASSKDHVLFNFHSLMVWAIGIRLEGISRETLLGNMRLISNRTTQPVAEHHPDDIVFFPDSRYSVIGGGASLRHAVNSCGGSLLTATYPLSNGWYAKGKDHIQSCETWIDVWAIGIKPFIPDFGNLDITRQTKSMFFNTGGRKQTDLLELPPGFVPASLGAHADWGAGVGRLLWKIRPVNRGAVVGDKDHVQEDKEGNLHSYIMGLRRR
jgi:hypothetical protein